MVVVEFSNNAGRLDEKFITALQVYLSTEFAASLKVEASEESGNIQVHCPPNTTHQIEIRIYDIANAFHSGWCRALS